MAAWGRNSPQLPKNPSYHLICAIQSGRRFLQLRLHFTASDGRETGNHRGTSHWQWALSAADGASKRQGGQRRGGRRGIFRRRRVLGGARANAQIRLQSMIGNLSKRNPGKPSRNVYHTARILTTTPRFEFGWNLAAISWPWRFQVVAAGRSARAVIGFLTSSSSGRDQFGGGGCTPGGSAPGGGNARAPTEGR